MRGNASTRWPAPASGGQDDGQAGVLGMPRFDPGKCDDGCRRCVEVCLPEAIRIGGSPGARVEVDYGRCIACQACVEACPTGALATSQDWAFGVRNREDLVWAQALTQPAAERLGGDIRRVFGRSLHVRHVDAGSCNGCESELQALGNPIYNLHRLGIFFTPSPRFADLLLVTGPVTYAMRGPLLEAYAAMPEPKFVMALGTCAVSGGTNGGGYSGGHGLEGVLPVDVYLPGCPPNPAAIIHALLLLVERQRQRVRQGRVIEGEPHA
ncbi:4Fe-4S dicluster domain-containing protein [Achromobacter xylosoxidans]|uniref:NADH-quinone oxidoreductase subunit B family protein n=2 Tax=Alcaligenes xylosoxydans xylosoxydans TaxID=85698 RepID=UPI001F5E870A|nr:4Fe-4S dicluster domain-containing protein [Achromobacter xylosoxidans]